MNDKELLELALAAKAAGYEYEVDNGRIFLLHHRNAARYEWCPLYDDGDALRLAACIPACVVIDNDMQWCVVHLNGERGKYELVERFGSDPCAATRRAIVRAAAEIGRSM
jgi:hypothetical protein